MIQLSLPAYIFINVFFSLALNTITYTQESSYGQTQNIQTTSYFWQLDHLQISEP
jgi:hypothetical protein